MLERPAVTNILREKLLTLKVSIVDKILGKGVNPILPESKRREKTNLS